MATVRKNKSDYGGLYKGHPGQYSWILHRITGVAIILFLFMRTTDRPSWVQVTVNGTVIREQTVPAGTTLRFKATRTFEVRLGDAGAVVLTVDGKRVPTGSAGSVADLSFALRNGRVVRL